MEISKRTNHDNNNNLHETSLDVTSIMIIVGTDKRLAEFEKQ